jgi:flavin reductase (DIM6/NTAB) family NADH-FMN oxidoreductase RutF
MGRFATGVTIITTAERDQVHGMTANGFMSVSLEPRLVVVSVANSTKMAGHLNTTGRYGVSVLARDHESLSNHFAARTPGAPLDVSFADVDGVPIIAGAVAWVATRIVDAHPAGDHTLFVGEVTDFAEGGGEPLIFHAGSYRELLAEENFTARWTSAHSWF